MIVEGRGKVAPAPVRIAVGRADVFMLRARAVEQAARRRYRAYAADPWKRGLSAATRDTHAGDLSGEELAIYAGLLGEWATCCYLRRLVDPNASPDLRDREDGDDGIDVRCGGVSLQVKTRRNPDIPNLVRRAYPDGRRLRLPADAFVFCYWRSGVEVDLLGWTWTRDVLALRLVPARRGDHFNSEVPDEALSPMSRLVSEVRSRAKGA